MLWERILPQKGVANNDKVIKITFIGQKPKGFVVQSGNWSTNSFKEVDEMLLCKR